MAGLRERKKRQTRKHLSDVATALFLERGFDAVTVAEVADAAEVSVNTVYNYFPAKEDLFFDRGEAADDLLSAFVRERRAGESAAEAVLRRLRQDVSERARRVGAFGDRERFDRCVHESPALIAGLWRMIQAGADRLTATLREEAGAAPDDPVPELVAGQLNVMRGLVFRTVGAGAAEDRDPDAILVEVLRRLDAYEELLSATVLDYARRPSAEGPASGSAYESDKRM